MLCQAKALPIVCFLAVALCPRFALAQTSGAEVALAEALYREARELMANEDYAAACPKFAESQRLDPATGTLLNLAACHERQGRIASAWLEYSDAIVAARLDGRDDRVKFVEERLAVLQPLLPRLTLVVPAEAEHPELEVRLDGALVGLAARGVPTPLDPGVHQVEARAKDKKPWFLSVTINETEQKTISVPKLEDVEPAKPTVVEAAVPSFVQPALVPPQEKTAPPMIREAEPRPIPTRVYVAGAATVGFAIAAAASGGMYLNKRSSYQRDLDRGQSFSSLREARDDAHTLGLVNVSLLAATLASGALTSYFYLTRPRAEAPRSATRISPWASARSGGVLLSGGF